MSHHHKILVSACLMGAPVRYDGASKPSSDSRLERWRAQGQLVAVCPECLGGLSTPRPPAEIQRGDAQGVLNGDAQVLTDQGLEVTHAFIQGAQRTLTIALEAGCTIAILKQWSPSCGSTEVYDGTNTRTKVPGVGVTTLVLRQAGIAVFGEDQLDDVERWLDANSDTPHMR